MAKTNYLLSQVDVSLNLNTGFSDKILLDNYFLQLGKLLDKQAGQLPKGSFQLIKSF